jgi:hypothetical protein
MFEKIKYSGQWWSPTNPSNKLHGTLDYSQDAGARLELDGAFADYPKTINGNSSDGIEITLDNCLILNPNRLWGNVSIMPSSVYAHQLYIGSHFYHHSDIKFRSVYCQLSNLYEWLGKSGFTYKTETGEQIIKYKRPETISVSMNPELKLAIDFGFSSSYNFSEINLKQMAGVHFYFTESKSVEDYFRLMHHFRNLLCLATQVPIFPQEIIGYVNEVSASSQVKILYELDAQSNTKQDVYDSLFTFKDIENKFESCLQNWYTKYDILEPVCQLYFGSLYGRFVYLNLKFLCFVQALEAYHRRTLSNDELPKAMHNKRISSLVNTASLEYKEWLQDKLAYSNEPNLRRRLKELFNIFSAPISTLIPDGKFFINKVVDTRNYMTHYDLNLKGRSAEGKELFIVTEKLRILIEMCLMKEIGFSLEEINILICKRYLYRLKQYEK